MTDNPQTTLFLAFCFLLAACKPDAEVSCIDGGVHIGPGSISLSEIEKEKTKLGCTGNLIEGSGQDVTTIK